MSALSYGPGTCEALPASSPADDPPSLTRQVDRGGRACRPGSDESWARSVTLFRAVLGGESFEAVASQVGITRTAVERRVKRVALHLIQSGGVPGLHPDAAVQVGRLRDRRDDLLAALAAAKLAPSAASRAGRVLEPAEVALGAHRLRAYAGHGQHDLALYHLIFATGLRPLEVARLQVADYLTEEGQVRRASVLRAEAAINGRPRPLHFRHRRLDESMSAYLAMRHAAGHGRGQTLGWRGLAPESPLFLTCDGQPYHIAASPPTVPSSIG